jgi:hypothetical protein
MAKVIVHSTRRLSLGLGGSAVQLKVGRNSPIDSSLINEDSWYVKSLKASGVISIEKTPEEPSVENGKLIEAVLGNKDPHPKNSQEALQATYDAQVAAAKIEKDKKEAIADETRETSHPGGKKGKKKEKAPQATASGTKGKLKRVET